MPRELVFEYRGPSIPIMTRGQLNHGSERSRVRRGKTSKDLADVSSKHFTSENPGRDNLRRYHRIQKSQNPRKIKTISNKIKIKRNLPRISREVLVSDPIKAPQRTNKRGRTKNALKFRLSKTL